MQNLPPRLRRLDKQLERLDGMTLSELDGYLAGIAVCPDLLMPSEWLPNVWGGDGDDEHAFGSMKQAQSMVALIMEHYNAIVGNLRASDYVPIYEVVSDDEDPTEPPSVMWEYWVDGLMQALALKPDCWTAYANHKDQAVRSAYLTLLILIGLSNNVETGVEPDAEEDLELNAPDLIPLCLLTLHAATPYGPLEAANTNTHQSHSKIGRNDPCPCGSGRKYKKCCAAN